MITLLEVLNKSTAFLEERGVQDARLSAEWIMAESLDLKRLDLYLQFERPLKDSELAVMREGIKRRAKREPLQYILGTTEFYGVTLKTDSRALIPRPETEYLVELLHTRYLNREPKCILDLGTGCGAIAIALLSVFPQTRAVAVDKSVEALALTEENGKLAGVSDRLQVIESDWYQQIEGAFELIVANPPYLTSEEMDSADAEVVQYEPRGALYGGEEGQKDLIEIVDGGIEYLVNGGMLVLETGIKQHAVLMDRAKRAGFTSMDSVKDLNRRDRFLIGLK